MPTIVKTIYFCDSCQKAIYPSDSYVTKQFRLWFIYKKVYWRKHKECFEADLLTAKGNNENSKH